MRLPQRIVCLTEETTETIYALGESDRIVGISGYTVRPSIARKEKPKVSSFISANLDKIIDLKPDLVIGFSDVQAEIASNLIKRGIQVLFFNQRSIDEIFQMILILGSIVNKYKLAVDLIDNYREKINKSKKRKLQYPPKVYFEEWDDPMISGIGWVSELIEIAGGVDIFSKLRLKKSAKERFVKSKMVIDENPDIIIASWCGKKVNKERIISREGWNKINAIKSNRIYEIKSSIILQPGPACLTDGLNKLIEIIDGYNNDKRDS
ncbi:MAG: cobalamin-binding protein [Rhodospirillaceae bacterium]|nr:cobalamin-binding protein [Rhodospirillaceae bacterium]|tara:strand:+ start:218 stop:1012 length:795 start_codon:yes stop_codon:yes gene_type:complete